MAMTSKTPKRCRPAPTRRRTSRPRSETNLSNSGLAATLHCKIPAGELRRMTRVFNFSAGPAVVPVEVLEQLREELLDWHGHGMSVMEMSHRGKTFVGIAEQAEADLRELLAVPANYRVLFLQGGATAQFAAV